MTPRLRGKTHLVAAPLTLVAGAFILFLNPDPSVRISVGIFILSAINLFALSALYHVGNWSPVIKQRLRRLDHSNIYLLIAGTYTPVAVLLLDEESSRILLIVIWVAAVLGVVLSTLWITAPRFLSVAV
ncbi:MAG: hypothetical protein RIS09_943, partial [Actinomycetota bacterium]